MKKNGWIDAILLLLDNIHKTTNQTTISQTKSTMADDSKSPSKAHVTVTNPYLKKAPVSSPERQTIPSSPAAAAINNSTTNPKTPPKTNPYLKNITPATADAKPPPSESPSKLTPAQRAKMEENRKRAFEKRVASLEKQEPNKKARLEVMSTTGRGSCVRCGGTDEESLCMVWNHTGEIQRERSYTGWDNFRWSVSFCNTLLLLISKHMEYVINAISYLA
jgi:hypothetical protein